MGRREPCGNRITASARWRGGLSAQVAHRTHHEEVRPRQDLTPCPSLILPASTIEPPSCPCSRRNSQSIPLRGAYLPAPCTSIPPRAYPPAHRRPSESN